MPPQKPIRPAQETPEEIITDILVVLMDIKRHLDEIYDEAISIRTELKQSMLDAKKAQGSKAQTRLKMAQAYRLSRHQGHPRPATKHQTRQQ